MNVQNNVSVFTKLIRMKTEALFDNKQSPS